MLTNLHIYIKSCWGVGCNHISRNLIGLAYFEKNDLNRQDDTNSLTKLVDIINSIMRLLNSITS